MAPESRRVVTIYAEVLFVHAIGVFVLVGALTIEAWILFRLRRVAIPSEARIWTVPVQGLTAAGITALVLVYATGAYLTESLRAWEFAWPRFAVLEIALFAVFGALTGSRLRAIRRIAVGETSDEFELHQRIRNPLLKVSLSLRVWIVIGTTLLTAAKPGLKDAAMIVAASAVLGLATAQATLQRRRTITAAG